MKAKPADLLFSFDSTGSMSACLGAVRREVEKTVQELFNNLPDLRVGIIVHNDYCDGPKLCLQKLELTTNQKNIVNFIRNAQAACGGDEDECYEAVLNEARKFNWETDRVKALVIIGDANPHYVGYRYGNIVNNLNWQQEAHALVKEGISIYSVQALGRRSSNSFYQTLADISGTPKLDLAQFGQMPELLQAICYKQSDRLGDFEALLRAKATSRIDFSLLNNIDRLAGRGGVSYDGKKLIPSFTASYTKRSDGLVPVHPSRFQVLEVDRNYVIKDFVEDNGLTFKKGRGFYEFTKSEVVQENKEVIVQDKTTGEMFSGTDARKIIGLPFGTRGTVRPDKFGKYRIFIQSTSFNRRLMAGTNFLYEVEGIS